MDMYLYPAYLSDTNALPKTKCEVLESAKWISSSLWMVLFITRVYLTCSTSQSPVDVLTKFLIISFLVSNKRWTFLQQMGKLSSLLHCPASFHETFKNIIILENVWGFFPCLDEISQYFQRANERPGKTGKWAQCLITKVVENQTKNFLQLLLM